MLRSKHLMPSWAKALLRIRPHHLPLDTAWTSQTPGIWIGGCGRSGTTLLRVMLGAHSALYAGPELNVHTNLLSQLKDAPQFLRRAYLLYDAKTVADLTSKFDVPGDTIRHMRDESRSFPEFVDRFLNEAARMHGKMRWVEKTPKNVAHLAYLFEHFPESKFIHVIRDGRDVACSLRRHPEYVMRGGELVKTNISRPIGGCIRRWVRDVTAGRAFRDDRRYLEVRYGDLLEQPEEQLRRVCAFLDIPFEEGMLSYHESDSYKEKAAHFKPSERALKPIDAGSQGRWVRDLSHKDALIVEKEGGSLLRELGYTKDASWTQEIA